MTSPPANAASGAARGALGLEALQSLFPDYELQILLGHGGMGSVYRARHRRLDRLVALKVLRPDLVADPEFAERFEREARALAMLDHPGIVELYDFGRVGDHCFLAMQFVDGANLRDLLRQGDLSTRDVLSFVPQLCDALQYAHDHKVVHRDIKPENILIDQEGRVHIADFGLAKLLGQQGSLIGLTQTHQAMGTPHYMAPEQIVAAGAVDHRADLYSLGVVIYEMLTGKLPIGRFQPPSAKGDGSRAFDPVVMKSLENDPARRYQQANEVRQDVEAVGRGKPSAASRHSARIAMVRQRRSRNEQRRPLEAWRVQLWAVCWGGILILSKDVRWQLAPLFFASLFVWIRLPNEFESASGGAEKRVPWTYRIGSLVLLVALFLPWFHCHAGSTLLPIRIDPTVDQRRFMELGLDLTALGGSIDDIPLWCASLLGLVIAGLAEARALRAAVGNIVLWGSIVGFTALLWTWLVVITSDTVSLRVGSVLTLGVFECWTILEIRSRRARAREPLVRKVAADAQ